MGCDFISIGFSKQDISFNPRTHMGCDSPVLRPKPRKKVSIHAPTWGATQQAHSEYLQPKFQSTHPHGVRLQITYHVIQIRMFQSTHPHGVRHKATADAYTNGWFQSTHPHGVRLLVNDRVNVNNGFNPRTHMGCDCIFSKRLNITLQKYIICDKMQK